MNAAALESWLTQFGLTPAERVVFARLSADASLSIALREEIDALLPRLMPALPTKPGPTQCVRFAELLADVPTWDFSLPWIQTLCQSWLHISADTADPEWLCALTAALQTRIGQHSHDTPAVQVGGRVLFFVCAMLLRAGRGRAESDRQLASSLDEATGLYRSEQALALSQAWIDSGDTQNFALCVLRVTIGPVLLRLSAGLERALMRQISARLHRTLRSQDALFRGGEWEWLMLMPAIEDDTALPPAVARLLHLFDVPFDVFGREYRLSATAGATRYPAGGKDADALLRSARIALFEAQRSGVHFELFRSEMDHSAARYAAIEHSFLEALHNDKLELYLQPQVDAHDGVCRQAEALLRWGHATGHIIAPQFIVEMAEEAGARNSFSRWLVTRAVRTLAQLQRRGLAVGVSINLTANDLADPELPELIRQALALWRVDPSRLAIELTESAIIPDEHHSLAALHALRALGCRLAVDDFGTGYSSMAYLRQLPLDELKIDQLFVRRLTVSEQDREIVRSMLQLAHGLHLQVVAEGVEDQAAADLLREYGCQRMQGFLFAHAMPLDDFIRWHVARSAEGAVPPAHAG